MKKMETKSVSQKSKRFKVKTIKEDFNDIRYENVPLFNYSFLSKFKKHGPMYIENPRIFEKEQTDAMRIGTVVDIFLTSPEKIDSIEFINIPKLQASAERFIQEIQKYNPNFYLSEISDSIMLDIMNMIEYNTNKTSDFRIKKMRESISDYIEYLRIKKSCEKRNKINIDASFKRDIFEIVCEIKENNFYKELFIKNGDIEIISQAEIYNEKFKGKPDYIIINHDEKTIQLIDLKITERDFMDSFYNFNYYLQAEIYTNIMKDMSAEYEYTVLPFKFMVYNKIRKVVLFYLFPIEYDLYLNLIVGKYRFKCAETLANEVNWHRVNDIFNYSKCEFENHGIININKEKYE